MENTLEHQLVLAQKQVDEFNSTYAAGCKVDLTLDDGSKIAVTVNSKAAIVGGTAVVWFNELPQCYAVDRVNTY